MQKLFLVLLFLLTTVVGFCQFSVGYRYGIGSHGVNFAPDTYERFQEPFFKSSHGLILTYNNENNAGVQLEVNYAPKGWHEEIDTIPGTFYNRNLDYIEVPIYAHFEIGQRMLRPIIIAGPYLAWKINDTWEHNGFDDQLNNPVFDHYHQEVRDLDFGIKLGVGLRLNINKRMAIFGEAHYDVEMAGGRDIFFDRPENISISRLQEISGVFGILWHILPQKQNKQVDGYTPKENLYINDF